MGRLARLILAGRIASFDGKATYFVGDVGYLGLGRRLAVCERYAKHRRRIRYYNVG
jgi:hypothetical protein